MNTVAAALAVQSELNRVQLELEQGAAAFDYLEDQVAFATVSLEVRENRSPQPRATQAPGASSTRGALQARASVTVVGWTRVAAATIAPVVLLIASCVPRRAPAAPRQEAAGLGGLRRYRLNHEPTREGRMANEKKAKETTDAGTLGRLSKAGEDAVTRLFDELGQRARDGRARQGDVQEGKVDESAKKALGQVGSPPPTS